MARINRGDILTDVDIVDVASDGKAVGKKDGIVVFVSGCVPGDMVNVYITKSRRKYYEGKPVKFIKHSEDKIQAPCEHFGVCGGCKWQNLNYSTQLQYKQKQVFENLMRIGKVPVKNILQIIPAPDIYFYRNKLEFTFTNKRWLTENEIDDSCEKNMNGLGFHVPGFFSKVVDIKECLLQNENSNAIRLAVKAYAVNSNLTFFDLKTQEGFLRNLIIRNTNKNDTMVIVVFYYDDLDKRKALMDYILDTFPFITSLMYVINPKKNDTINDLDVVLYKGQDYITERMDNLDFKIGPKSFFQTNSKQAHTLYKLVKEFASLTGSEVVYDLYTGTGTIAMYLADSALKVIGIEYIEQAIENAKENSLLNNIHNTIFVCGVMEKILDDDFINRHGHPDIVITDPPRSGMHNKVLAQLLEVLPKKIVYVSCNPATQARDIAVLSEKYKVVKIQPVDMFPQTAHVEIISLLEKVE